MKVVAIVLLCAVAAVQGRSAGVQSSRAAQPAPGDVPYLVHLRRAIGTSGLLQTGAGCHIASNWILTSASAVHDSRFIWIRFGAIEVPKPLLVIESNTVTAGNNDLVLISLNRHVESTENYYPVPRGLGGIINQYEFFCAYGETESNVPGESLYCYEVTLVKKERVYSGSSTQALITGSDLGAPVVSEGRQTAVLIAADGEGAGTFKPIDEEVISWVESVTNLDFSSPQPEPEPEPEA